MKRINILAVSNGVGITRDVDIIKRELESDGYEVECNHTYRIQPKHRYDLNIHLERFNPYTFDIADKNVMIPNQEWFEPSWSPAAKNFDVYFTKTRFRKISTKGKSQASKLSVRNNLSSSLSSNKPPFR
mgnify:CR=1 FL=1